MALGDGRHGFAVSGVDLAGRIGTSDVAPFTIDTAPARTSIAKHPPKLIRTHRRKVRAAFRFRSNEAGATFVCKVDRGLPRFCEPRISRRFEAGRHTVQVKARDAAGNVDRLAGRLPLPRQAGRADLAVVARLAWRRTIQLPTRSRTSSAAAVPKTSGSVSFRPSSLVPK